MDRPALSRLLADIKAGRIDVVVVYKVDRLTRSLADFAKLVELFDTQSVSFVSVTQSFNTTSSMGRLTLNVLCRSPNSSVRLRVSVSATRLPRPNARGYGWAAWSPWDTASIIGSSSSTKRRRQRQKDIPALPRLAIHYKASSGTATGRGADPNTSAG